MIRSAIVGLLLFLVVARAGAADAEDPEVRAAIERGVSGLRSSITPEQHGRASLAAYALLKAGVPATDGKVVEVIKALAPKFTARGYRPRQHHFYEAGCDLMLLEAADAEKYEPQIEAIAAYIVAGQQRYGAWYYPDSQGEGDTSITQYAVLGLWAADRAGVEIHPRVWDRLAQWQVATQQADGGFAYHPSLSGNSRGSSKPTMTVAGVANLYVARRYLYPDGKDPVEEQRTRPEREKRRFGVLEKVDLDAPPEEAKPESGPYRPRTPLPVIDNAIRRGLVRAAVSFAREEPANVDYALYYLYGVERMAALADVRVLGGHDWYARGKTLLLRTQSDEGTWTLGSTGEVAGSSFALLFLSRATSKILGRKPPSSEPVASGLLAGGKGLPKDLTRVTMRDGRVEERKLVGPVDELLASLEDPQAGDVRAAQQALVEKVRTGSREELVDRRERLLELLEHPDAEVRRTAVWALGRTDDLRLAETLVDALEDESLAVVVEARNALCYLLRKPQGLGLPHDPHGGLPEIASRAEQRDAERKWRERVTEAWRNWLEKRRLYDRRDRLPR